MQRVSVRAFGLAVAFIVTGIIAIHVTPQASGNGQKTVDIRNGSRIRFPDGCSFYMPIPSRHDRTLFVMSVTPPVR